MKKIAFFALAAFFALQSLFSFTAADANNKMDRLALSLNQTLPSAATEQNVYSSAWIGKLFPSSPPNLALGIEAGVSRLDLSPLKEMAELFGIGGLSDLMVYPTVTANFRLGGLVLPFDIGFSCMYMNFSNLDSLADGLGIQFFTIGGDIRYAILTGEEKLPQLSLGAGYYYIGGKISYEKDGLDAALDYSTHTLFAQLQLSKTFIFFTPYAGFRGIFSKSAADWRWSASGDRIERAASYAGSENSGSGTNSSSWADKIMPQAYGGFGLNLGYFALNIAAAYEFRYKIWGGDVSLRFQM